MDPTLDKIIQTPRFVARRRAVRAAQRRRYRRIAAAILTVALIAAGGIAASRSLLFDLNRIEVIGAVTVAREDVVRASGLRVGQSALGIDLSAAASAVEALPGVGSARVERDGSLALRIVVVERKATVEIRGNGRRWYLDDDGAVVQAKPTRRVPVIVAASAPGIGVSLPPGTVRGVLVVWRAMPPVVRRAVESFDTPADGTIRFRLGHASVVFGSLERVEDKIAALILVRQRVARDGSTLLAVDLTAPDRPAARVA